MHPVLRFLFCLALAWAACSSALARISAVATTTMVADLVEHVGGERVQVEALMGPGVDPHLYKAKASDVIKLQQADTIFYNGLHLEGRMTELFEKMAKMGRKLYAVGGALPKDALFESAAFKGYPDPHIWGDAALWSRAMDEVVAGLSEVDPAGRADFARRGEAYKAQLLTLHAWAKERVKLIPEADRILVTSHDAFNYLGRAYGLQVIGVQGISTATEAGLGDIAKVAEYIRQKKIKAIFVESSVPKATIERIAQDSGAQIGGELFSDAMGTPGEMETVAGETYDLGTYEGMLRHNVNAVVEALK